MNFRLLYQIAITHLTSRPRQTLVAALGVTFGIAMYVLMISFMTGVNDLLEEITLSTTAHIRLYNDIKVGEKGLLEDDPRFANQMAAIRHQRAKKEKKNIKDAPAILENLKKDPRVMGVSAQVGSQVFYNFGSQQINGIIAGVDILAEDKLYDLHERMTEGTLQSLLTHSNGLIMGVGLAEKLSARVGDLVLVTTPSGGTLMLKVVGFFQTGITAIDDQRSYTTIVTAQRILGEGRGYLTDINLKLNDMNSADVVAREYAARFGCLAEDWKVANAPFLVSIQLRNIMTYIIVTTLLTVAGFGIYNIMNMTIYEKIRDIAILKATGFNGRDVITIFMTESMLIGVLGAMMGLPLGFVLSYLVSLVPFDVHQVIDIDHLPMAFKGKFYAFGTFFALATTALAGFMPARRAARIDPVEIIRGK